MKKTQSKKNSQRQSPAKLTFLFVMLPVLVVILMVIFWVIFKETRKQVEVTALRSAPTVIVSSHVAESIDHDIWNLSLNQQS